MEEKLLEIINEMISSKGIETLKKIQREYSFRDDLGFDSFDLAELTVRVEDVFGIDIFEDGLVNTLGEVEDKIRK
jgi:acyl carrier protein